MLSKEEIEKAKERIQNSLNDICFATLYSQEQNDEDEKTLLQYIDQLEKSDTSKEQSSMNYYNKYKELEKENKALKKGQNALMASRKKWKDRYYKLKEKVNKLNLIIDEMAKNIYERLYNEKKLPIAKNKDYYNCNVESVKKYFEKKVEEKINE